MPDIRKMVLMTMLTLISLITAVGAEDKYTLDDLLMLEKNGQYAELLVHLTDVRPSQRNEKWNELVERAAVAGVQKNLSAKQDAQALYLADQLLELQPALKNDSEFLAVRKHSILGTYSQCLSNNYATGSCLEQLSGTIEKTPDDHDLAMQVGKLVRRKAQNHAAVPFFLLATAGEKEPTQCQDEDLLLAVLAGMELSDSRSDGARTLAFDRCYKTLHQELLKGFYASSGYGTQNYCKGLEQKHALTPFQQAYCADH